ncbi:MAG TPA: OB-fold nucleic acid binding domain-containing protein, partial [Chloroflexota bacterium]|nr:OB-fold nucleic acid binding domain-containing protein [Chloroflexota bacterium]
MPTVSGHAKSIRDVLGERNAGERISVNGWVRTVRTSKAGLAFVELNDGSSLANLQVVAEKSLSNFDKVAG